MIAREVNMRLMTCEINYTIADGRLNIDAKGEENEREQREREREREREEAGREEAGNEKPKQYAERYSPVHR